MDKDDLKMYLENIEEFVMDEDKIVTYKWLSSALNLHANTAKQLLYYYTMPDGKPKANVEKTYLIGGYITDGSDLKFQIVREESLENVKSRFKLLTSEHIYSVQKLSTLQDLNILFAVDNPKNQLDDNIPGPIRCENARRKPRSETSCTVKVLVPVSVPVTKTLGLIDKNQSGTSNDKSDKKVASRTNEAKANTSPPSSTDTPLDKERTKGETSEVIKSKDTGSSTRTSIFTVQSKANVKDTKKVGSTVQPPAKKSKGGIAMFFSKQVGKVTTSTKMPESNSKVSTEPNHTNGAVSSKVVKVNEASSEKKMPNVQETFEDKTVSTTKVSLVEKKTVSKKGSKIVASSGNEGANETKKNAKVEVSEKQSRSLKKKKLVDQVSKGRKRIMVFSDDSSSGSDTVREDGDERGDSSVPNSPEENPVKKPEIPTTPDSDQDIIPPTPPEVTRCKGKVRKRKLVDKTYEDKDGFMVTKKEMVFEICTDDEDENDQQTNGNRNIDDMNSNVQISKSKNKVNERSTGNKGKNDMANSGNEEQLKKKKVSSPIALQKSKQSSIMSFFGKN